MSIKQDRAAVVSVANSLLASISEILESIECFEEENSNFIEIGCYMYRASAAVLELQTSENVPENAIEMLQSLSNSTNKAKLVVNKSRSVSNSKADPESILALQSVINEMGEIMIMVPPSTFWDHEFVQITVQALSDEMKKAKFEVNQAQISQIKQPENHQALSQEAEVESDLYPVDLEVSIDNSQVIDLPHLVKHSKETRSSQQGKINRRSWSTKTLQQMAEYIEPLYESFYCPLTKHIMEDPVTIESGVTYEREAIAMWFEESKNSQEVFCPTTGQKLLKRALRTNMSLKTTIEEWKQRNDMARIKVSRAALSLASSAAMVLDAIRELQDICRRREQNKVQILNAGVLPCLAKYLEYKDRSVRCGAVELLLLLAEDDDDTKEMIAETVKISAVINMLSSGHQPLRHAALLLLLELSGSESLCEKIGSVVGGILMLIRMKYNRSVDAFSSEKAEAILRNLQRTPENVKQMAENGFLEPLLNHLTEGNLKTLVISPKGQEPFLDHLTEGSEEMQMEMANCLGEVGLGGDNITQVAKKVCPTLITMVHNGDTLTRRAAFRALGRISSHRPNAMILQNAGIIQVMIEEMFTRRIHDEPMNSVSEAAAILANLFDAAGELDNLQVGIHGHKLTSDYVLHNIIHMLKNSTPDILNLNLIRVLLCLSRSPKSMETIVSVLKEAEASYTLVELINNPNDEVVVAAIKFLIAVSPYMGHALIERLCRIRDQPENLIEGQTKLTQITEKQAFSAKFLAKLPHQNLTLNLALSNNNMVPKILDIINQLQRTGTRISKYAITYLEGLVGILVRFTATLYEPQILLLARSYNLTVVFTELLVKTSSDEVQKLSAIGLENLSAKSVNLSKPPQIKRSKFLKLFYQPKFPSFGLSKKRKPPLVCPVHKGACSSQETFCLIDAKAVERLLSCLDHENVDVVEAALSAICTLLDDRVDLEKSVSLLTEVNTIEHVLNVVKQHDGEGLRQQSFWVIEKFLKKGGDKSALDISQDRMLLTSLITAFHSGDGTTKQMAEKILRHLNKMPHFHTTYYVEN